MDNPTALAHRVLDASDALHLRWSDTTAAAEELARAYLALLNHLGRTQHALESSLQEASIAAREHGHGECCDACGSMQRRIERVLHGVTGED